MWCPHCKDIQPCYSVTPSQVGETGGRRFYKTQADDVNFYRRFRECTHCGQSFETSEVEARFLDELVELREALADIKANAAAYEADAKKAAETLKKLGKSLGVLKALK
jgi:DNA replicative helicase MCM subunit Mcm2 (Cdc46/Mcm family)